jgi:hypothetical protein
VANAASILLGKGDGTFTVQPSPQTGSAPIAVTVGDFNADGNLDFAVANDGDQTVSISLGYGNGTFATQTVLSVEGIPRGITVGDFDGDGRPDLAIPSFNSQVTILLGNGNGTFRNGVPLIVGIHPERVVVADFNADGKQDLALVDTVNNTLDIALGKGDGSFAAASMISLGTSITPKWLGTGDFNQDGKADLVVTAANNPQALIFVGNGNGTFVPQTLASSTSNAPQFLAIGDFNGDGESDLAFSVYQLPPASALLNSLSTSATATLSGVTLSGTGNQSVQAQYVGSTADAPSRSNALSLSAPDVIR